MIVARRLGVGDYTVSGVRWLLGFGRLWGKRLSSAVVYRDRPVVLRGNLVWFSVVLQPVEQYIFGQ